MRVRQGVGVVKHPLPRTTAYPASEGAFALFTGVRRLGVFAFEEQRKSKAGTR